VAPGPNSAYQKNVSVSMPMNGDKHNMHMVWNDKSLHGYGWAQMAYVFSFVPKQASDGNGLVYYKGLPENQVTNTTYDSGSKFTVGFNQRGFGGSWQVDDTVQTSIPSWEADVGTVESSNLFSWTWHSEDPDWQKGISKLNTLNLGSFQPNSSCVMTTNSVLSDVRTFTMKYGARMLTLAGTDGATHERLNQYPSSAPISKDVQIDFSSVLYPVLQTLIISPSSVVGGTSTTGTVTIDQNAPADGVVVNLSSSNTNWATVPSTVTIPNGQASETFTITTYPVTGNSVATITVELNKVKVTATVTVTASP
jgi:hypothetical protein